MAEDRSERGYGSKWKEYLLIYLLVAVVLSRPVAQAAMLRRHRLIRAAAAVLLVCLAFSHAGPLFDNG
jgi:hypothetical protein